MAVGGFSSGSVVKNLLAKQGTQVQSLGWNDPLEKEMATHSSILAWEIPWTRSLMAYSPRGHKESDMTERLHFHFNLAIKSDNTDFPLHIMFCEKGSSIIQKVFLSFYFALLFVISMFHPLHLFLYWTTDLQEFSYIQRFLPHRTRQLSSFYLRLLYLIELSCSIYIHYQYSL